MLTECLVFLASAVCLYGVGINRAVVLSSGRRGTVLSLVKSLLVSAATVSLTFLLTRSLLVPAGLQELFPMLCVLVFCLIAVFFEGIIRLTAKTSAAELSVSFLSSLLAVNESVSLAESVLFSISCLLSFYLLVPVLHAVRRRNEAAVPVSVMRNSLVLFSLAALILCLLVFDVSWLTGGLSR